MTVSIMWRPRNRVVVVPAEGEGRTRQSMKDECDINVIMRKYQKTGALSHVREYGAMYGDFEPLTFHDAMETVRRANEMFADLPSSVRKRFNNDPGQFMEFVGDPEGNREEMIKLGLIVPKTETPGEEPAEPATSPE